MAGLAVGLVVAFLAPMPARAGKLSWLDDVVQEVVREAKAGGQAAAQAAEASAARSTGRLFAREADEGLEVAGPTLRRPGPRRPPVEEPAEALLQARFARLAPPDPEIARTFAAWRRPRSGWSSRWARPPSRSPAATPARPRR